jgi:beta-lactamase class A
MRRPSRHATRLLAPALLAPCFLAAVAAQTATPAPAPNAAAPARPAPTPAQTPSPTPTPYPSPPNPPARAPEWLDARVRSEVAAFSGTVRLYARNLDTGAAYSLGGDERVRTASTIKLAVMVEAFARVSEGRAKWSDELLLTKEKKVGGSGILNELSDGLRLTFRDAVNLMMTLSDNTATNLVIDVVTADAVNARMASLGLSDTRLMRKVFGGGVSEEGKRPENARFGLGRSSPREMVALLEKLERGELVSPAASREMLELLKRERGQEAIGRSLWRVPKATKSGALDALRSNVGIVYTPRGRVAIAVTCDDMPEAVWTPDNPALLLMSRLSEILIAGLGRD